MENGIVMSSNHYITTASSSSNRAPVSVSQVKRLSVQNMWSGISAHQGRTITISTQQRVMEQPPPLQCQTQQRLPQPTYVICRGYGSVWKKRSHWSSTSRICMAWSTCKLVYVKTSSHLPFQYHVAGLYLNMLKTQFSQKSKRWPTILCTIMLVSQKHACIKSEMWTALSSTFKKKFVFCYKYKIISLPVIEDYHCRLSNKN